MAKLLTRDDILQADDLPRELVKVEPWGGSVYVRGLNGAERDQFEAEMIEWVGSGAERYKRVTMDNARAKLAARTICDEDGKRLFNDADIDLLAAKSAVGLQIVFDVAMRLSGLTKDEVEELAAGLPEPSADSGSG